MEAVAGVCLSLSCRDVFDCDGCGIATLTLPPPNLLHGFLRRSGIHQRGQRLFERRASAGERYAVLWALGAGDAGLDRGQVKFEHVAVFGFWGVRVMEQALLFAVGFD